MSTLIFHNPGEIDIRGACIAGLSAKEINSPIGYFGTGLKYSIACILRWGGEITIYSGETEYKFTCGEINYRGVEFKQIYMNDTPIGFTTEYGKNWQPWQVFRELYANARDENGFVQLDTHHSTIGMGWTHIFVSGVSDLVEAYHRRDEIILPENKSWTYADSNIMFSLGSSPGLYYRGVRVYEQPCMYTWNFLNNIKLTEDRTMSSLFEVSYRWDTFIAEKLEDEDIIQYLLELKFKIQDEVRVNFVRDDKPMTGRSVENLLLDWFTVPNSKLCCSQAFQRVACRMYQRDPIKCSALRPLVQSIDESLIRRQEYTMSVREQMMFDKAKELVAIFGFENEINVVPIHVQELGGTVLGLYENGLIFLSPKLFDQGTKQLVATLYEECYHHRTAQKDCTYSMQSDLFNIIVSLNEELHKVIC